MDTVRYFVALLMLPAMVFAISYWLIIHPLAGFWRRFHPLITYGVVTVVCLLLAAGVYLVRAPLLSVEFGTSLTLIPVAIVSYGVSLAIEVRCRKYLKFRILAGLPEVTGSETAGKLLTEGIYSRLRNPRYVGVMFAVIAVACFTNYLISYLLIPATALGLYVIVILEERELGERFGSEYQSYCDRVPRFLPKMSRS
ncbi:MAG: methyltransferase family protein [Gemmatimonadales bacterium]